MFGWIFIIFASLGLLIGLSYRPLSVSLDKLTFYRLYFFFTAFFGLIAGIFILNLKEWARKLEIVLRLLAIGFLIFSSIGIVSMKKIIDSGETMPIAKKAFDYKMQEKVKMYKPEYQQEALNKYEKVERLYYAFIKKMPMFVLIFLSILLVWHISIIYFFTRPQVKAQFIPEQPTS